MRISTVNRSFCNSFSMSGSVLVSLSCSLWSSITSHSHPSSLHHLFCFPSSFPGPDFKLSACSIWSLCCSGRLQLTDGLFDLMAFLIRFLCSHPPDGFTNKEECFQDINLSIWCLSLISSSPAIRVYSTGVTLAVSSVLVRNTDVYRPLDFSVLA